MKKLLAAIGGNVIAMFFFSVPVNAGIYKTGIENFLSFIERLEKNNFSEYYAFIHPIQKEVEKTKIVKIKKDTTDYLGKIYKKYQEEGER